MFFAVISLFFTAVHYLVYSRVVKKLHIKEVTKKFFSTFLILNLLLTFGYTLSRYTLDVPLPLYYIFSLSIGIGFFLLLFWLLYELLYFIQRKLPFDPLKREFLKRGSDIGFISLSGAYVGLGLFNEETQPKLLYVDVKQKRFKTPYKIAQLSDLHIGGLIDREFIRECVDSINKESVDLVVITGDLVDTRIQKSKEIVAELQHLRSKYGTYYVVGNHEYFHGVKEIMEYLHSINIEVLQNDSKMIDNFYIVGVYDIFGERKGEFKPDLQRAFKDIPDGANTLLLMHQPKGIYALEGIKPSLILSGHTHGGQLWPFGYMVELVQPYLKGLYKIDRNRHIYVNRGLGYWGPPMRIGSQAEITIISWS